jgi:hypothetical protein
LIVCVITEHHLVNTESASDIHKQPQQQQQNSSASSTKGNVTKEVCLLIDLNETQENYQHRKMAYDEVKLACQSVNSNLQLLQFGKLDFVRLDNFLLNHFNNH